ncbi:DMT family transporter [Phytoactinopolyspora limicola]|uniref:DMT family transporter n=1 Tax=Phytoactinopolyspora limicola TaxID=2715536 RepID=UPI00140C4181|nr:DMT family transporter [Phytoactinopolyspora limicola]
MSVTSTPGATRIAPPAAAHPSAAHPSATPAADAAAGTALVVLWSSGFVGARLGADHAGPDTLLAWRLTISAVLLLVWFALRNRHRSEPGRLSRAAIGHHVVIGVLTQALYLGGVFAGIAAGVPAGTAALMAALQPLVVAQAASRLLGERVRPAQHVGLWLGLAGVGIVVADDFQAGGAQPWAYLLPIGSMLALSAGTVLDRRWRPAGNPAEALTVHVTSAAVVVVVIAAISGGLTPPASAGFWWAVGWTVVLSGFGGYGMYLLALRRQGATRTSALLYLTPPTTLFWAWIMFGDRIDARGLAGFAVCAVAVYLSLRRSH